MRRNEDIAASYDDEPEATGHNRPQRSRINSRDQSKRTSYARRGATPTVYNGMHRRRKKRIMW